MFKRFRLRKHNDAPKSEPIPPSAPARAVSTDSTSFDWTMKRPSLGGKSYSSDNQPGNRLVPNLNRQGLTVRSASPSPNRGSPNLGLRIVHQPTGVAPVDIIFVHGLGGNSRDTWSKNHDPSLCWPELWLPLDVDIRRARVLSFGYNASLRAGTAKGLSNIADFAKELLYEMRFGRDNGGESFGVGRVPIVFVSHSMGGLVAKKAYLLAQNDDEYEAIIRSVSAMIFLGTPHRGSNLADVLNRILGASFQSTRRFIDEINTNSSALEDINEQFRHVANRLSIFSFYETLATKVGPKRLMIVEKDSAILGYAGEISKGLNADHHDVCKYTSPDDPNYISVRNVLKELMDRFQSKGVEIVNSRMMETTRDIEKLFAGSRSSTDDLDRFSRNWTKGTCEWILNEPGIVSWLSTNTSSRIAWLTAPPATGKSVLASFLITYLRRAGASCQFFFFRFGDQAKRSVGALLRSIAQQFAMDNASFWRIVSDAFSNEDIRLDKLDFSVIWQRIFDSILLKMDLAETIYWIVDALDESDSPKEFLDLLKGINASKTPVHILIISRKTEPLLRSFDRLSKSVPVNAIHKDGQSHNHDDIKMFVEQEMQMMRGDEAFRQRVTNSVVERAQGNFLWTRLVMEEVLNCHTEEAINETLDEIPSDMNALYQRMEQSILNNPRKADRRLARELFQWIIFSRRSLSLRELAQGLEAEFPSFIDLRRTVQGVCGQFILVDDRDCVSVVHQTARDYIIDSASEELCVKPKQAHAKLLDKTLSYLSKEMSRVRLLQERQIVLDTYPFLLYAATSWPYHLQHAKVSDDSIMDMLVKFLKSTSIMVWIQALAVIGQLQLLIRASKALNSFVKGNRKLNVTRNPLLHRLSDLTLLEQWATDLLRIAGKFSKQLETNPTAIHTLVPAICPENSMLRRQFYQEKLSEISITGVNNSAWSDHFAKLSLPSSESIWNITCAGQYIAVLGSTGRVSIYDTRNFTEICVLDHSEPVTAFALNDKSTRLVTYGLRSTNLWSVPNGELLSSIPNLGNSRAMTIRFGENDSKILCGCDDKSVRQVEVDDFAQGWRVPDSTLLKEHTQLEGSAIGSPMWMQFNNDATQIGVAYRGFPLSVWSVTESRCLGRCKRSTTFRNEQGRPSTGWFGVDRFTWNPVTGHVIGIYRDGCVFKWHPITGETHEAQSTADEVAASPNGSLFITSDSNGTIRIWNFFYLSVIYQLKSGDLVTGLTFSPDSKRFYDVRGSSVNAWEPNSLTKLSESEDMFSDTASEGQSATSFSNISEAIVAQYEPVTAFSLAPNESAYCVGNEEGVVSLKVLQATESLELVKFFNFLSISHLAWSQDSMIVAVADLSGEVAVRQLTKQLPSIEEAQIQSYPKPKLDLEGRGIHQLLCSPDGQSLVIVSDDLGQVVDTRNGEVQAAKALHHGSNRRWRWHTFQNTQILAFGAEDLKVFNSRSLEEEQTIRYQQPSEETSSHRGTQSMNDEQKELAQLSLAPSSSTSVTKILQTQDEKHILVQIRRVSAKGRASKDFLIFDPAELSAHDHQHATDTLQYRRIPAAIASKVEIPLGVFPGSRFVFLDQELWVCTYKLGSTPNEAGIKRFYFVPRDWTTSEGLEQCVMARDGTLFCPKDDQVATIKSNIAVEDL